MTDVIRVLEASSEDLTEAAEVRHYRAFIRNVAVAIDVHDRGAGQNRFSVHARLATLPEDASASTGMQGYYFGNPSPDLEVAVQSIRWNQVLAGVTD
ncbi:hypothetical protein [Microbacterium sp. P04]|uniref:hypothetical protein n=1 Tax=Microbacterium sp. P04 TaxID=3366947 RepID=UPI003745B88D